MKNKIMLSLTPMLFAFVTNAQRVVNIFPSIAPGSEEWTYHEQADTLPNKSVMVFNVSTPTLTVYEADKSVANGTAVIICPGGGFRLLSITTEGVDIAKWFNKQGITAFVLKYRLVETDGNFQHVATSLLQSDSKTIDSVNRFVVPLSIRDGQQALKYIRDHAREFRINSNRVGIIGFSAGATVSISVAQTSERESSPDFVAGIYAYTSPIAREVSANPPPLFLAMANDDPVAFGNTDLYERWRDSKASVEIHIYSKGGHGFGVNKQNLPSDRWLEEFNEWLHSIGMLTTR